MFEPVLAIRLDKVIGFRLYSTAMNTTKTNFLFPGFLLFTIAFCMSGMLAFAGKQIDLLTPKTMNLNKHWVLEKGILYPSETPGGIIWSKEKFGDFKITLQYKTSAKANSGLFFRSDRKMRCRAGSKSRSHLPVFTAGNI